MYRQRFPISFPGDTHTRHCVALSVIIPPPTNFRRQKKNKRKTRKPVTRVWVGFLQDCHLRCAVRATKENGSSRTGTLLWSFWLPIYVVVHNLQRESLSHGHHNRLWHNRKCVMSSRLLLSPKQRSQSFVHIHTQVRQGRKTMFFLEYINEYIKTPGAKFKKRKKQRSVAFSPMCQNTFIHHMIDPVNITIE